MLSGQLRRLLVDPVALQGHRENQTPSDWFLVGKGGMVFGTAWDLKGLS